MPLYFIRRYVIFLYNVEHIFIITLRFANKYSNKKQAAPQHTTPLESGKQFLFSGSQLLYLLLLCLCFQLAVIIKVGPI